MGIPPRKSAVAKAAPKKLEEEVDEETVSQVDKAKAKGAKLASTSKKAPPPPKEEEEDELDIDFEDEEEDDVDLDLSEDEEEAEEEKKKPEKKAAAPKTSKQASAAVEEDAIVILNGMNSSINSLKEQVVKSVNPVSERVTALESDVKDLTAELKTLQIQVQEVLAKLVQVHQSHSEVSSQVLQELAKLNYGQGKTNVPVKKEEPKEPPRSKTPEEILESANLNSKVLKLIIKNAKVGQPAAVWSKAFCKKLHSTGDPAYTRLTAELCLELLQASGALDGDGNVQEADQ